MLASPRSSWSCRPLLRSRGIRRACLHWSSRNSRRDAGQQRRESFAIPIFTSRFVSTLPLSCDPSGGRSWARCPHPSRAATGIASSSSELTVSERLAIGRGSRWGDGISDTPGGPVYVPYALPGETVEVEHWPGHPDRRRLLEVETASPERLAPICPHFGICGGCAFQHWASAHYREWKRALVIDALAQFGIESAVDDLIDAHGEGRRRAVVHARRGPHDLLEVGFVARKQHRVIAIDHCPILAPSLRGAIAAAWSIAEQIAGQRKPLDIQAPAPAAC